MKNLLHTPKGNRIISLCIFVIVFATFIVINIFDITFTGILPECGIRAMTGLKCPGCGGTRCMQAFFNGDFVSAFYYNAYITSVLIVLAAVYVKYTVNSFSSYYKPYKYDISVFTAICIPISIVLFVVIRNTQFYQHFLY